VHLLLYNHVRPNDVLTSTPTLHSNSRLQTITGALSHLASGWATVGRLLCGQRSASNQRSAGELLSVGCCVDNAVLPTSGQRVSCCEDNTMRVQLLCGQRNASTQRVQLLCVDNAVFPIVQR
jgi:hypothetical protein